MFSLPKDRTRTLGPLDDAVTYLTDNKNTHFDPQLVDLFIESDSGIIIIESGKTV